jgi:hypothetical protein
MSRAEDFSADPSHLCGVRFLRGGAIHLIDSAGLALQAGQHIVIDEGGSDRIGAVVIGTGQVHANEAHAAARGRARRLVQPDDLARLERNRADAMAMLEPVREHMTAMHTEIRDAWTAVDGSRATILLEVAVPEADGLARQLEDLLGMPVTLVVEDHTGGLRSISGPGFGLSGTAVEWLVASGAEPILRSIEEPPSGLAAEYIEGLFPRDAQWPPPRPSRSSRKDHDADFKA